VQLPVAARRLAYRAAYRLLQLWWLVGRPSKLGVKCLLTHEDRILLVRHTYGHRAWDIPGGAMRRNEVPLAAARREMFEELGVESAQWTDIGPLNGVFHHRRDTIYCFVAELPAPSITIDKGELSTASWFARDNLPATLGPYVMPILERNGDAQRR
jgi:ADP-ribose pyrophosphatase YjhB (NUDIX family)